MYYLGQLGELCIITPKVSLYAGDPDRMSDIDSGILRLLLYTSATLACISTRKNGPRLAVSNRMIHIRTSVSRTFPTGSRIRQRRKFPFRAKNCILCVSHISALELHSLFFGGNGSRRSYPIHIYVCWKRFITSSKFDQVLYLSN